MLTLLKAASAIATIADKAVPETCRFELPTALPNGLPGDCLVFDQLQHLPAVVFNLTDGEPYNDNYYVTSPCTTLTTQSAICGKPNAKYGGLPTPAVQAFDGSCLVLGDPATISVSQLPAAATDGAPAGGISLTLTHGDAYACGASSRTVRYNMICNRSGLPSSPPEPIVSSPKGCSYVVTWNTPLACPTASGEGSCGGGQPVPTPTPPQARYQDTDFIALIHFNMVAPRFLPGNFPSFAGAMLLNSVVE